MAEIKVTPIGDGPRRRAQVSTALLHEWAMMQPWDQPPIYELRLGPTVQTTVDVPLTPQLEAMLRRNNWYADLVGVMPGAIWVVESKVDPNPSAVGQALFYSRLVMQTPQLRPLVNRPIQPVVLFASHDEEVDSFAQSLGVLVEVFTPSWYPEYLTTKRFSLRQMNQSQAHEEPQNS